MLSILSGTNPSSIAALLPSIAHQLDNMKRPEAVPAIAAGASASNNKGKSGANTQNNDDAGDSQQQSSAKAASASAPQYTIQPNAVQLTPSAYYAEIYGQYIPQTFKTQLPYAKFLEYSAVKDKYTELAAKQEEAPSQAISEDIVTAGNAESMVNLVV